MSLRYLTSGESHGKGLLTILEGLPAGLEISEDYINQQLRRRQQGYGRGGRMEIETDTVEIMSGVRFGKTLGSPVGMLIRNKDWENWTKKMSVEAIKEEIEKLTVPRPGHADFAGAVKYSHDDIRNIIERSSARETAIRTAAGSAARRLLETFNITIASHIIQIGEIRGNIDLSAVDIQGLNKESDKSPVRCIDKNAEPEMMKAIDAAKEKGDSIGGVAEIIACGLPIGLGSHVHWDRRLDGKIAHAMMAIPAMKGVEIGLGFRATSKPGADVHDEIYYDEDRRDTLTKGFYRKTNNAGGIEGGMTNGEPVVVRIGMKPIPTLTIPLNSVDMVTKGEEKALKERSDTCAVPAAGVVAEAVLALVLADTFLEKYGNDSIDEMRERY